MEREDDWELTDRLHAPVGKGDPFAAAVRATRMPMLITDPRQTDNPIVFCNEAFLRLSQYSREEVLGRNCRLLQGPGTDREAISKIRAGVAAPREVSVDILNFKKDGTPFWNALYISPVSDEAGALLFFFASQLDVTERKRAEREVMRDRDRWKRRLRRERENSRPLFSRRPASSTRWTAGSRTTFN